LQPVSLPYERKQGSQADSIEHPGARTARLAEAAFERRRVPGSQQPASEQRTLTYRSPSVTSHALRAGNGSRSAARLEPVDILAAFAAVISKLTGETTFDVLFG